MACALLALASCAESGETVENGGGSTAVDPAAGEAPIEAPYATPNPEIAPGGGAPTPAPSPAAQRLALEGEGLRVFDAETGAPRALSFGVAALVARQAVQAVLGVPPSAEGESADCGLRFATWPDGLSLSLRGDHFVGWSLRSDASRLTTPTGVGIGSSRAQIEEAHVVEVTETSLGTVFAVGGMAGVLESPAPGARITALWAGEVCLAR